MMQLSLAAGFVLSLLGQRVEALLICNQTPVQSVSRPRVMGSSPPQPAVGMLCSAHCRHLQ